MGYSKYAELVFGWKLAGMPTNSKGEKLSPYEDEFMPYVEGHKGIEETIIYDQMCGDYVVFGKLLGHVYDCGDFETRILVSNGSTTRYVLPHEIKLILRPLSSMTEDELKECDIDLGQILLAQFPKDGGLKFFSPNQFIWLLNKSFDLFGLIESGLALDATKIEKV